MTVRSVIEHALTAYYADSRDPQAIATGLLDRYDAERDAAWRHCAAEDRPDNRASGAERRYQMLRDA